MSSSFLLFAISTRIGWSALTFPFRSMLGYFPCCQWKVELGLPPCAPSLPKTVHALYYLFISFRPLYLHIMILELYVMIASTVAVRLFPSVTRSYRRAWLIFSSPAHGSFPPPTLSSPASRIFLRARHAPCMFPGVFLSFFLPRILRLFPLLRTGFSLLVDPLSSPVGAPHVFH